MIADVSATFDATKAFTDGSCVTTVNTDNKSSSYTITLNGVVTDTCSHGTSVDCFCNTSGMDQNECTSFYNGCVTCDCNDVSGGTPTGDATTQTTVFDLSSSHVCVDGTVSRTGSYTIVETLSDECIVG